MNRLLSIDDPWAHEAVDANYIRDMWFSAHSYEPENFGMVMYGRRVLGYLWIWRAKEGVWTNIYVDPTLPSSLIDLAVDQLLSWARMRAEQMRDYRVVVSLGPEYGYKHRLLRKRFIHHDYRHLFTQMILRKEVKLKDTHPNYILRPGTLNDVPEIVRVFNRAFEVYEWFHPWNVDDARRWYERENVVLVIAEDRSGSIVAFADAKVFTGLDGTRNALIMTVAVDPSHQGRGLGRAVLARIVKEVMRSGYINRVFLDSVVGLEKFYQKSGFRIWRRILALNLTTSEMPSHNVELLNAHDYLKRFT